MNLKDYFTKFPNDHRLSPDDLLNKQWAWSWTHSAFGGSTIMTALTALLGIWPFFWIGVVLFVMYLIYIPILRKSYNFYFISNIFCIAVMLWAFATMLYMGGILTSFGLVLVGLNCAMSSVLSNDKRWVFTLFGIYTLIVIITGSLQPWLTTPEWVQPHHNLLYFVINAIWLIISALSTTLMFISDRGRLEKMEANRLKELDEVRTKFYTNITHEFRTPLTVIMGMAEQMKENPEVWINKGVTSIKDQSKRLLNLINQMMDISKLESGSIHLKMVHGDIVAYLGYLTDSFQGYAESNQISLTFHSEEPRFMMDYDSEKLFHIISNLISNAIKYTEKGGEINIKFKVKKHRHGKEVQILVKDNGIGIPGDVLPFIFDRYFQGSSALHTKESGSGLGLALTKGLVELLGGNIEIDSELGKGTSARLQFPVHADSTFSSDHGISFIKPIINSSLRSLNDDLIALDDSSIALNSEDDPLLLIVEDNDSLRQYIKSLLEHEYRLLIASNGKEGVEIARKQIPDIIISDVMMPEMDGLELLSIIKSDPVTNHIPVILLTALADATNKIKGLEAGADYYLPKPFEKKELTIVLKNMLSLREKLRLKLAIYPAEQNGEQLRSAKPEIEFLENIRNLVSDNCEDENFGVDQLCKLLHMSRAQLYRKFQALTGSSLAKYIRKIRLHKAREFLLHNQMNVSEAALESGFKNLSHFSVIFKEEFGMSPKEVKS